MSQENTENTHEETEIEIHKLTDTSDVEGKRTVHEEGQTKKKTKIEINSNKVSEINVNLRKTKDGD